MIAYACGSGGVMFVPDEIERQSAETKILRRSNDNKTVADSGAG
jgi:hypothetical protein